MGVKIGVWIKLLKFWAVGVWIKSFFDSATLVLSVCHGHCHGLCPDCLGTRSRTCATDGPQDGVRTRASPWLSPAGMREGVGVLRYIEHSASADLSTGSLHPNPCTGSYTHSLCLLCSGSVHPYIHFAHRALVCWDPSFAEPILFL